MKDKLWGSIIGGAIGDVLGGEFENQELPPEDPSVFIWEEKKTQDQPLSFSDDTQLTLATLEAIIESEKIDPAQIAKHFLNWYKSGRLSGLGSATLQALRGLESGGYWALVGKKGERAAGNGAAMRIAPLAFVKQDISRELIRDICRITHHNDEAYAGALAVYLAIKGILEGKQIAHFNWLNSIAQQLPDTLVRDRIFGLAKLTHLKDLSEISTTYGNSGYVVESIPFALFGVVKSLDLGFEAVMNEIISTGGDTDTNASIFGQIAGAHLGYSALPEKWIHLIEGMDDYELIHRILLDYHTKILTW